MTDIKLPEPKIPIVRKEFDGSHYYFIDGEFYPGVTTILDEAAPMPYALKQFFIKNTSEEIEDIKNTALGFGSKMHDAYEKLSNGIELDLLHEYPSVREKKHIVSFVEWFRAAKPVVFGTEVTIASKHYKFAGTLDLFCQIDGKLWIIDFKTSASIYESYKLQLAAYKQAFFETYGMTADNVGIVRTGTKHKAGYEFAEVSKPFEAFKRIYDTYLDLHDGKVPKPPMIDVYPDRIKV